MAILVNLAVVMAKRRVRSNALARAIGITEANLSLLKSGKVKGIRFSTLDAICRYLDCQPGDLLEFCRDGQVPDSAEGTRSSPLRHPAPHNPAGKEVGQ